MPTPIHGVPTFCEFHSGMVNRDQCDLAMAGLKTRLEAEVEDAKGKPSDPGTWIRWAAGILLVVLGAWWGMSTLFSERPTETKVDQKIMDRKPHPETKAITEANTKIINLQQRQLDRIEVGVDAIKEAVKDLKKGR